MHDVVLVLHVVLGSAVAGVAVSAAALVGEVSIALAERRLHGADGSTALG